MKIKETLKKVNIFDILIIVILVIALVIMGLLYIKGHKNTSVGLGEGPIEVETEFVVKVPEVKVLKTDVQGITSDIQDKDFFKVGQKVYTQRAYLYVGEITNIEFKPQEFNVRNDNTNTVEQKYSDEYQSIYLTIKSNKANRTKEGLVTSGIDVIYDVPCALTINSYEFSGNIVDIIK